jgi:hypothetical protein
MVLLVGHDGLLVWRLTTWMVLPDSLPLGSRTTGMADAIAQPRGHDPPITGSTEGDSK